MRITLPDPITLPDVSGTDVTGAAVIYPERLDGVAGPLAQVFGTTESANRVPRWYYVRPSDLPQDVLLRLLREAT